MDVLRSVALLAYSCACIALMACGPRSPHAEDPPPKPNLILITVDTLRADHMSVYGYARPTTPNLDALAQHAVVFDRAVAQWPKTGTSFASMFIGRYPQSTGLTHRASLEIPPAFGTLPGTLQKHGYNTMAVISNPVLAADLGWDRGFDEYIPSWGEEMSNDPVVFREQLSAQRVNRLAMELLERHGYENKTNGPTDKKPLFLWLHYSDPHAPYYTPEGFENPFFSDATYAEGSTKIVHLGKAQGRKVPGLKEYRDYVAQYDANVLLTDKHIGSLLEHLRHLGLLNNALTVVTADHGESLGEHGLDFEHGPLPYNASAHVPLLIVPPTTLQSTLNTRIAEPVELIDLAPTLMSILLPNAGLDRGLPPGQGTTKPNPTNAKRKGAPAANPSPEVKDPANNSAKLAHVSRSFDQTFEGTSLVPYLLDPKHHGQDPNAFSEAGSPGRRHYRSLQELRFKLIYRQPGLPRRPEPRDFELYDLLSDPLETTDLLEQRPDVVRRMRRTLLEFTDRAVPSLTEKRKPKSRKERQALKNLGYLQ